MVVNFAYVALSARRTCIISRFTKNLVKKVNFIALFFNKLHSAVLTPLIFHWYYLFFGGICFSVKTD